MSQAADEHRRVLADGLALADREIGELRARLAVAEALEPQLAVARGEAAEARRALADVTASPSWKLTAPLRALAARVRARRAR